MRDNIVYLFYDVNRKTNKSIRADTFVNTNVFTNVSNAMYACNACISYLRVIYIN